jgi:hypothetical protein
VGLAVATEHIIGHRGRTCEASRNCSTPRPTRIHGFPCRRRSSSPLAPQCPEHKSQSACLFGTALTGNLPKAGAHQAEPVGPAALRSRPCNGTRSLGRHRLPMCREPYDSSHLIRIGSNAWAMTFSSNPGSVSCTSSTTPRWLLLPPSRPSSTQEVDHLPHSRPLPGSTSLLPQERSAGLILTMANLGEHLR